MLCLVREKVRPARLGVGVSAKKFARRTQNGPKSAFFGVLGELFRGEPEKAGCWASFVAVLWSGVFLAARWCREGRRSRGRTEIRMQFPASIMPVCVSSGCCVTCVLELHAKLGEGTLLGWPMVCWVCAGKEY